MSGFVGKFKLVSQENFDDYMKAIGVGMAMRALARAATPYVEFIVDGDNWTIISTGMKDVKMEFKLNVEFECDTPDGRKVKNVFTLQDNKLIQKESWKDKEATYVREVDGDDLIATMDVGSVHCVRKYKRV